MEHACQVRVSVSHHAVFVFYYVVGEFSFEYFHRYMIMRLMFRLFGLSEVLKWRGASSRAALSRSIVLQ